jgi:general secretion pathway protein J
MKKMHRGFTLIEILVALMILAIIGALMVTGLRSAIRSQGTINRKATRLAAMQSAMMVMERDVLQIINRPVYDVDGSLLAPVVVHYLAGKLNLEFTRAGFVNPFGAQNRSTLQRVRYAWDGKSLIRTTWFALDRVQNTSVESQTVLTGVNSFTVRFLDTNQQLSTPGDTQPMQQLLIQLQQQIQQQQQLRSPLLPLAIEVNLDVDGFGVVTRLIPLVL